MVVVQRNVYLGLLADFTIFYDLPIASVCRKCACDLINLVEAHVFVVAFLVVRVWIGEEKLAFLHCSVGKRANHIDASLFGRRVVTVVVNIDDGTCWICSCGCLFDDESRPLVLWIGRKGGMGVQLS